MIVLDGASLTPHDVAAVARRGAAVELSDRARARNDAARSAIAALLERGQVLYGASTGVGALRDHPVAPEDRERLQWNLLRSHAVTAGRPVAPELVRAAMVVRANQLGGGGAGVVPELLDGLIAALNDGVVPVIHEMGSLGTGDLPALAEIALALLERAPPLRLGLRDALGFMSSNALTAGRAALVTVDGFAVLDSWLAVAALSFEALRADPVVLDERVQAARSARGQAAVAARMRSLLAGVGRAAPGRPVQDPYPFRVLPQVDGVAHDALARLEEVVTRECNSRGENALIIDGDALANGNFDAAELGAALDALRAALAGSASLIVARASALLDPRITGMTPFLAERPGPDSGLMMLEYTALSAASTVRALAVPMTTQSVWASLGVETHASLAATAARHCAEQLEAMKMLIATELVVALRALRMAGHTPAGEGVRGLFEAAARAIPPELGDREFGRDVERAHQVLADWSAER